MLGPTLVYAGVDGPAFSGKGRYRKARLLLFPDRDHLSFRKPDTPDVLVLKLGQNERQTG